VRILVCLKQVDEPEALVLDQHGQLAPDSPARRKLAEWDARALEEALILKDALPEVEVWAVTVGPTEADAVLQRALGMGADQAAHIVATDDPPPRPSAIAAWLAEFARERGFDLILCGVMSEDAMQGLVGPMLAEVLGLACTTGAVGLAVSQDQASLRVEREMEGGRRQAVTLPLPALVTVGSSPRQPRYPSLSHLLRAKKTPRLRIETQSLAPTPIREERLGLFPPQRQRTGLRLAGDAAEKAAQLRAILQERSLL
jgi:electron transfer flavoprotein beta subunit